MYEYVRGKMCLGDVEEMCSNSGRCLLGEDRFYEKYEFLVVGGELMLVGSVCETRDLSGKGLINSQ